MNKLISNPLTSDVANDITATVNNSIQTLMPFHVALSEKQRQGRSMAEGREGMVRLMSKISLQHINSLSRNDDPQDMVRLLTAYDNGGTIVQALKQLMEMVEDTQKAVGMDLMILYRTYNDHLQADRKNNTALDASMGDIDEYNKRFGPDADEADEADDDITPAV